MRIRVKYYLPTGKLLAQCTYETCEAAFTDMIVRGRDALAYPVDTKDGVYNYRHSVEGHTLELFKEKMESCK